MRRYEWEALLLRSHLTRTARLVAFVLATYLNAEGEAWPAVETLARGAGVSARTAQRALGELRRHGYVFVKFRKEATSLYRVQRPPWLTDVSDDDYGVPF